jgi:hypothetical protein
MQQKALQCEFAGLSVLLLCVKSLIIQILRRSGSRKTFILQRRITLNMNSLHVILSEAKDLH